MKRFAPFITCFYLCSLFFPLSLRANVLPIAETTVTGAAADDYYKSARAQLKVISNDKIGQTLIASEALSSTAALSGLVTGAAGLAGVAYYERTGKDPVYAAFNAVASAADALFVPAYQAFRASFVSPESYPATASQYVGVEGSVGATLGGLLESVKNSASDSYTALKALLASNTDSFNPDHTGVSPGAIIAMSNGVNYKIISGPSISAFAASGLSSIPSSYPYITLSGGGYAWRPSPTEVYMAIPGDYYHGVSSLLNLYMYIAAQTNESATLIPSTSVNYANLKSALSSPSPAVSTDLKNVIKNLPANQKITSNDPSPNSVPANGPSPITNTQIKNFFAQNTTNIYNQSLETITDNSVSTSTVTNDVAKAAAEAAKAQEEEAEKQTEETFNPISDSAFAEPYNPGEFDIPARFTTFLNNVKSSGLFSFSNNFFNSLPSGGSPIFEIEGGIFGSHSIDLSETMSGGLAVLKTVLLALFGFLSIRAVIMKR